jgi:hypothetical protein
MPPLRGDTLGGRLLRRRARSPNLSAGKAVLMLQKLRSEAMKGWREAASTV